jgi:hypothetical protein
MFGRKRSATVGRGCLNRSGLGDGLPTGSLASNPIRPHSLIRCVLDSDPNRAYNTLSHGEPLMQRNELHTDEPEHHLMVRVAHLVECSVVSREVAGSIPVTHPNFAQFS